MAAFFGGLINFGAAEDRPQQSAEVKDTPIVPEIMTTEVLVPGVLVSINHERRQSLLLLDMAIVVHEAHADIIDKQRSKVVNSVLRLLSKKEEDYFYNDKFIKVAQQDLIKELTTVLDVKIEDVLITKAVYQ